ncbi:c-type cytochrome biogenesis protein CcsB [Polaromonas sp. P5_D5]
MNTSTINHTAVNTTTLKAGGDSTLSLNEGYFARRNVLDWVFAALVTGGLLYAFARYSDFMDVYEKGILFAAIPAAIAMGWFWRPLRVLMMVVSAFALLGIASYQGDLARAEQVFWLKYFLSSQSAILWMSVLFFMSTIFYWLGMFASGATNAQGHSSHSAVLESVGSKIAWAAVSMALIGTLVRWYESYLIGADVGHIPVSNLYEVFVLFCWLTTTFYLYFEAQYNTRTLGAFVMLVVSAAVGFLLWYTVVREAHEIQPLVPALKSWWMKLHVPANFIGYGTFALSAMVALTMLLKTATSKSLWIGLVALPTVLVVLPLTAVMFFGSAEMAPAMGKALRMVVPTVIFFVAVIWARKAINAHTPDAVVMDDLMYKAIAVGFAFFTIATVLGALWAAEAWGGYWSWDPKETWALIVWLNYAAWLHMRLMKGLRGTVAAWWALVGLVVTSFAFLGVNMFLSGLHSYGTL